MGLERSLLRVANRAFDMGTLLRGNIKKFSTEECVVYWSIIDLIEKKLLSDRKKAIRQRLLDTVAELGTVVKGGSKVLKLAHIGGEIKAEKRGGAITYNVFAAENFVAAHVEKYPAVKNLIVNTPSVNEEALIGLRKAEVMSQDEYDSIVSVGPPAYALKVKVPRELSDLVKEYAVGD